ncbi:hypothetical protein [Ferrimicrobium sp.]|uniref:hypothetical protein n=1 Tax=Ferrimicrobium sp. TaxID=2926050 RepID=UPI0026151C05|nr:hypothetical protein [Ferrimicrobium sp.]
MSKLAIDVPVDTFNLTMDQVRISPDNGQVAHLAKLPTHAKRYHLGRNRSRWLRHEPAVECQWLGRDLDSRTPPLDEEHLIGIIANHYAPKQLRRVSTGDADLLIDCLYCGADDAPMLLPYRSTITKTIMISSKAVYVDRLDRDSNSDEPPNFAVPIDKTRATLGPNGQDGNTGEEYGTSENAAEETLEDSRPSVAILRPSKSRGAHARRRREWVSVRHTIEQRLTPFYDPSRPGSDHPSAASNIAALLSRSLVFQEHRSSISLSPLRPLASRSPVS